MTAKDTATTDTKGLFRAFAPRRIAVAVVAILPAALLTLAAPAAQAAAAGTTADPVPAAGPLMPDVTGRNLLGALGAFDGRTRVDTRDVGGEQRRVLWPANWKVCSQYPKPGTDLTGRTATLGVVKNAETCPAATDPDAVAVP
ncbi:hypothetical protein ACH44C_08910 [Streptomyces purpureus]|uniref:hypothetical protein n=1 Tax=Streptomyces purpureus TaxID=1951 RepID=UPI00036BBBDD|nr:hypothetical protein [Streptomyces purpureus]